MSNQWQERIRPTRLEKRYEFANYANLRDFLDRAAEISEREGLFPDMGFGRDYVNITIYSDENSDALGASQQRLAAQLDDLLATKANS